MKKPNKMIILGIIILVILIAYDTYNYVNITEKTIQVGYLPSNHHAALFVAEAQNMYEKEGIRVQLVPFRTGSEVPPYFCKTTKN
jgi:NitT/TauT family transport system substrate-binding protein